MNNPRPITTSKSSDASANIESKIARYIRGEISANMISSNSRKDRSDRAINAATNAIVATTQNGRRGVVANKSTCKTRPPFRSAINARNTNFPLLAMIHDLRGMPVSMDSDILDVETICLCKSEFVRKFVPEPGSYMQTLKQKLAALQNRNASK